MLSTFGILFTALIATPLASGIQQPASPTPDAERHKDVYAIYSLLMSNPPSSLRGGGSPTYAIQATTGPAMGPLSRGPNPCIVPPSSYAKLWEEVLADFNARKDTPATLDRALNIAKPYVYLQSDEARSYVNPRRTTPSQPLAASSTSDMREVFRLSDVYFDKSRTLALTGIGFWCGDRCSYGEWKIYEKASDGSWKALVPERTCTVEA